MINGRTVLIATLMTAAAAPLAAQVRDLDAIDRMQAVDAAMARSVPAPAAPPPPPSDMPRITGQGATITLDKAEICLPASIAKDRDIVVLSMNGGGGANVPFAIGESGQAAKLVTVSGGSGRDVVLVLAAQNATLWDLRGIKAGRIKAVVAHGAAEQAIVGVGKDVQTEFASQVDLARRFGSESCGVIPASPDLRQLREMTIQIRKRFGRSPDRLYAGIQPVAFDLDGAAPSVPDSVQVKPEDVKAAIAINTSTLMPGVGGMMQLVQRGDARPFSMRDVIAWKNDGGTMSMKEGTVTSDTTMMMSTMPPDVRARYQEAMRARRQEMSTPRGGFVLLRDVPELPRGFNPNMSMAIVVPEGVKAPATAQARGDGTTFVYTLSGIPAKQLAALPTSLPEGMDGSQGSRGTPVTMAVTWKDDAMTVRFPNDKDMASAEPAQDAAAETDRDAGLGGGAVVMIIVLLAVIGGIGGFFWWKRNAPAGTRQAPAKKQQQRTDALDEDEEIAALLTRIEGMAGDPAMLSAISDFRHQVSRLAVREDLDADLTDECGTIVDERFSAIATRYVKSRAGMEDGAAAELDQAFRTTVSQMARRLAEIHEEQNRRNIAAMSGSPRE